MSAADRARATALFLFASGAMGLRLLRGIYAGESHRDGLGSPVDCTPRAERIPSLIPMTEQMRSAASTPACYPLSTPGGCAELTEVGLLVDE